MLILHGYKQSLLKDFSFFSIPTKMKLNFLALGDFILLIAKLWQYQLPSSQIHKNKQTRFNT